MIRGFGPKKNTQKRKNERKQVPFLRVAAEIQIDSTKAIADSRVFLSDMSPSGVGCFVNIPILKGEAISLFIRHPKQLFVKGEVMWCSPYTLSVKVLSSEHFEYRIGVRFTFENDDERKAIKKFCDSINSGDISG